MEAFTRHRGVVFPLDRANVDTDAILPKQFLKKITRIGFGGHLFHEWRFNPDGSINPDFLLNREPFTHASILVARNNFGCGSSREHAVWAVKQFGFLVVIAATKKEGKKIVPAFADIFRNNSAKNGLLLIELAEGQVDEIFAVVRDNPGLEMTVDLPEQMIILHGKVDEIIKFEINPLLKEHLIKGLDDIGLTEQHEKEIANFEKNRPDGPWVRIT